MYIDDVKVWYNDSGPNIWFHTLINWWNGIITYKWKNNFYSISLFYDWIRFKFNNKVILDLASFVINCY